MIDDKLNNEIRKSFSDYLTKKNLKQTGERCTILNEIFTFPVHFDVDGLHQRLNQNNFHVSKSTVYNTLELLIDAEIIIRHQIKGKADYELRKKAETHLHFICNTCGGINEMKNTHIKNNIKALKTRFTTEYFSLYVYGLCYKCKKKQKKQEKNNME
jgi:Fur family ferric uptake transcriptional regulator